MSISDEVKFFKIAVLDNIIEAQIVDSILNQHDIPHHIRSYHDTAYDGLFQFQKGWGEILAPQEFKEEILEIIQDLKSEQHNTP